MAFQIGGNLLDTCVLAILSREDTYGYRLTQEIRAAMNISESTLYPVLRRLQRENLLVVYDVPYQGRNRRYYQITEEGKQVLFTYLEAWESYKAKLDHILLGGNDDE